MEKTMTNVIAEVAQRIRALRESCEVSVEEMAVCTGVTVEAYKQLEAGETDFTFTFIYKCASRLGADPTDLLKGQSPTLSEYTVNRKGEGLPIARRKGFDYKNLASMFKDKIAEPFCVTARYSEEEQNQPIKTARHNGQEFNLVLSGSLKVVVDGKTEVLGAGDSIYYNSALPHGMIATGGADCTFLALVMNRGDATYDMVEDENAKKIEEKLTPLHKLPENPVVQSFIECDENENGLLTDIRFKDLDKYNFAYDTVDAIAKSAPTRLL